MAEHPLKAVYLGTPAFSANLFERLFASEKIKAAHVEFVGVITNPERPAGRNRVLRASPVKSAAETHGIRVLEFASLEDGKAAEELRKIKPDIMIMCAYGQMLPADIVALPKRGILNIHYSLLPLWRGSSPVQFALLHGDKKTGVTAIVTDEKMDHGPIIARTERTIDADDDAASLIAKLTDDAAVVVEDNLADYLAGNIAPVAQNDDEATYCRLLRKEDGKIRWEKTSREILNQIRAFSVWPQTHTYMKDRIEYAGGLAQSQNIGKTEHFSDIKMVKIFKAKETVAGEQGKRLEPGTVYYNDDNNMMIKTADEALMIELLQMEGKRETDGKSFLQGYSWMIGKQFVS